MLVQHLPSLCSRHPPELGKTGPPWGRDPVGAGWRRGVDHKGCDHARRAVVQKGDGVGQTRSLVEAPLAQCTDDLPPSWVRSGLASDPSTPCCRSRPPSTPSRKPRRSRSGRDRGRQVGPSRAQKMGTHAAASWVGNTLWIRCWLSGASCGDRFQRSRRCLCTSAVRHQVGHDMPRGNVIAVVAQNGRRGKPPCGGG